MKMRQFYPGPNEGARWYPEDIVGFPYNTKGDYYFVDGDMAAGSHAGRSWADAYPTITEALAAASDDDVIFVSQGTYTEDVLEITQNNLKLIGLGGLRSTTIYNSGITTSKLMTIEANNVELAGFRFIIPNDSISVAGTNSGIAISSGDTQSTYDVHIHHCRFNALSNYMGNAIRLGAGYSFESGTIEFNQFYHGACHVDMYFGSRVTFRNNQFTGFGDNANAACLRYASTTNASFGVKIHDNSFDLVYTTGGKAIWVTATPTEGYLSIGPNDFGENFNAGDCITKLTGYSCGLNTYGSNRLTEANPTAAEGWD